MSTDPPRIVIGGRRWPLALAAVGHIEKATGCGFLEARLRLQTAMLDGDVRSRGPIRDATADPIDPEFWRFAFPDEGGQALNLDTLVRLEWFEVNAEDVLAIWPESKCPIINGEPVCQSTPLWPDAPTSPDVSTLTPTDRTGAPGAPSSMHLIEAEMLRRAQAGQMLPVLAREADYLAAWLRKTHPQLRSATPKGIANRLRDRHRHLKSGPELGPK